MQSGPIAAFSANAEKNACLQQASIRRAKHTFRQVPLYHTFRRASVWRTGPIFSTKCHTPSGEGANRLNIVWLPERAFHAGSMPCSYNGLLFVSRISCWRRKNRPFKSKSSTSQKKPASKGSRFPPFEKRERSRSGIRAET